VDFFRKPAEVMFPRFEGGCVGIRPKQGIALPQRPSPAAPNIQRTVFHVEHAPIQKAAPLVARTRN